MPFWKIKIHSLLLSVFLCTIIVSSGLIISFTYVKYSKSIHEFSLGTIDRSSHMITEKIGCIVREIEKLPSLGMFFYQRFPNIDMKNKDLIAFFLGILKHDPDLYAYHIALPGGSYLSAYNLSFFGSDLTSFEPVPKNANFVVLIRSASPPDGPPTSLFYNRKFELLSSREFPTSYDPRTLRWYVEAVKAKTPYWTNPYPHFFEHVDLGFVATEPFYDSTGKLIAVIAADLSFNDISALLTDQHISKNGKTFIVDAHGKIFLPRGEISETEKEVVSGIYKIFEKNKQHYFSYKFNKEIYLASAQPFPTTFNKHWTILTVAPRSDFFAELISTQKEALLLSLAVLAVASLLVIFVSIRISKPIVQLGTEIDRIARLDLESTNRIHSPIEEIGLIDASVASMRTALRSFGHYVPKELAKQLMLEKHEIVLGGEKKTISIFFTDIDNFTSIAETLPIERLSSQLTEYFEVLTKVMIDCGGTIDKYIGDSIMSLWGAPGDLPDFTARACKAALLCQKRLSTLHAEWRKKGMPLFETRMGITTGSVFVGNFGTSERMNYSAIGDAVNTAARLQVLNKTYHTRIIVGEDTIEEAGAQFLVRPLEIVNVRGKKDKLKIFELVAFTDGAPEIRPTPEQIELCRLFTEAYDTFAKGDLAKAKTLFQAIHEKFPDDVPTNLYLDRLK